MATPNPLIPHLQTLLQDLIDHPYPTLPNPEGLQKRASVALIIRLNPSYSHWPTPSEKPTSLQSLFSRPWTEYANPEVLFIKRSARKGDRWTSHIALPGGKLDPSDPSDSAAAIRETFEEVGIDLSAHALECGNLPQRLVTTHWGKKPLLVLCPFVYILTSHDALPALRLQPTEVASTHWVPITSLRDPERRTVVFEDVSARLAAQETGIKRWILASLLGKMVFAAISLEPAESLHSRIEVPDSVMDNRFARTPPHQNGIKTLCASLWNAPSTIFAQPYSSPPRTEGPLLLWGLTLGVISDFLDLLPPKGNALEMWTYPSFTPLDVRFMIWIMTLKFKNRKRIELQSGAEIRDGASFGAAGESVRVTGMDGSTECLVPTTNSERADETGFHGLGTGLRSGKFKSTMTHLLEGWVQFVVERTLPSCADGSRYYELVRRAVILAMMGRVGMGVLTGLLVYRAGRRRGLTLGRGVAAVSG